MTRGQLLWRMASFRLNATRKKAQLDEVLLGRTVGSLSGITVAIGTAVILFLSGRSMRVGAFTVGNLALYIFLLNWITSIISSFGDRLVAYQRLGVSFDRLQVLLAGATADSLFDGKMRNT